MVTDSCTTTPRAFERAHAHGTTQEAQSEKLNQLLLDLGQGITPSTDIAQESAL